jgi:hypothetical protein
MRGRRPYVFADTLKRRGLNQIVRFIETARGLAAPAEARPEDEQDAPHIRA